MATGVALSFGLEASGKPVDLPTTVANHPSPEACVGFMEGRWVANRSADQKVIEEWRADGEKQYYKGNYTGKREIWRRGKLVSSMTMYVQGTRFGAYGVISKTKASDRELRATIQPIWGEKVYITEITTDDGELYTYSQSDTNRLTLTIDDLRNKTSEMIEFKRSKSHGKREF